MKNTTAAIVFTIVAILGLAVGAKTSSAATVGVEFCENDKCIFGGWCQDGGLGTKCNMGTLGGCINENCERQM